MRIEDQAHHMGAPGLEPQRRAVGHIADLGGDLLHPLRASPSLSSGALLRAREIVVMASPVISAMVRRVGLPDLGRPRLTRGFGRGARSSTGLSSGATSGRPSRPCAALEGGVRRCDIASAYLNRSCNRFQDAPIVSADCRADRGSVKLCDSTFETNVALRQAPKPADRLDPWRFIRRSGLRKRASCLSQAGVWQWPSAQTGRDEQ